MDDRTTATVLYALRQLQDNRNAGHEAKADHFYNTTPLTNEEIDDLCEELNCSNGPVELHVRVYPKVEGMTPEAMLLEFVNTIEATGGVQVDAETKFHPLGDPEWIDLGEVYVRACCVLNRQPLFEFDAEADADPDDE